MSGWSRRERGLGMALVLAALAAFVVPAWADEPGEGTAAIEPGAEAAAGGEGFLVPAPGSRAEGDRMLPVGPSEGELEKFERCLGEHGIEPPPLPAEGEDRGHREDFGEAEDVPFLFGEAEDRGHLEDFGEAEDRGHGDELRSVPCPPPALRH